MVYIGFDNLILLYLDKNYNIEISLANHMIFLLYAVSVVPYLLFDIYEV